MKHIDYCLLVQCIYLRLFFLILAFLPQTFVAIRWFTDLIPVVLGAALLLLVRTISVPVEIAISRFFCAMSTLPYSLNGGAHSEAYLGLVWFGDW